MPNAVLAPLDHLLQRVPEPSALQSHHVQGQGLLGILSLLGLDLQHQGKLALVLKTVKLLEAVEDMEIVDACVGDDTVEPEALDQLWISWNRDLQEPALTLDGSLDDGRQVLSLYARHKLSESRAAVNGHEVRSGLSLQSELDPEMAILRLIFEFAATSKTPRVEFVGELPVMDVIRQIHG